MPALAWPLRRRGAWPALPAAARAFAAALALSASARAPALAAEPDAAPIVLAGAIEAETRPLAEAVAASGPCALPGVPCAAGTLGGRRVLVVTIGVGKVNAAMSTAVIADRLAPAALVFSGIAGGVDPELAPGDVVVGERLLQHDLVTYTEKGTVLRGVRGPAGVVGPIVLDASPLLLVLARREAEALAAGLERPQGAGRAPQVRIGTIVTGDAFVGARSKRAELRERLMADAVEMEGAAVAQVCARRGIPFLVVRGLSDRAAGEAPEEARRNLDLAARNAARTALAVARGLVAARNGP